MAHPRPALALCLALAALPVLGDDGELDPTFSEDGRRTYVFADESADLGAALALAEGALLLGGSIYRDGDSSYDFGVVKLLEDGSTDLAFGSFGRRLVDFDPDDETGRDDRLLGLGRDGEDRLLLLGRSARESEELSTYDFPSVARLDEDGDLDPGFDGDGRLVADATPWQEPSFYLEDAGVAPDGKLVWVGYCYACPEGDARLLVVRRLATGAPDTNFDGDGWASLLREGDVGNHGERLAFDREGRILVLGSSGDGRSVFRLTAAGALDASFGEANGVAPLPAAYSHYEWRPADLAVDPEDGSILVALSHANADPRIGVVLRLDAGGDPVPGFGEGGARELAVDGRLSIAALALQGDRRIVVAGTVGDEGLPNTDYFVARLDRTGDPEAGFGEDGLRRVAIDAVEGGNDFAAALVLSAGRPVVAGTSDAGSPPGSFGVARLANGLLFADGFGAGTAAWSPVSP